MASFASDSDGEFGDELTASDEELLLAIADRLSQVSPQPRGSQPGPAPPAPRSNANRTPARNTLPPGPFRPNFDPDATLAIDETISAISDDDLSFGSSEFEDDAANSHAQLPEPPHVVARGSIVDSPNWRLTPSVSGSNDSLSSFVSKTKSKHTPTLLPGPDVRYPDLSRALSDAEKTLDSPVQGNEKGKSPEKDDRPPLLRFRTFPMKPFSVSDLTAGSWCELQYYYTLTRLPGGRKTRTAAMKRGTAVHEKLEREIHKPVQIEVTKKEDAYGLKIWNIIQGLRVLRDEGLTRELEVWGMVDGNLVNGIIDGLSYENPDPELQEDVLSSRGGSQTVSSSQSTAETDASVTEEDYKIYITDVKTRTTATLPSQAQVRGTIIQLFLYHRFLSDMASEKLDYIRVFERYGLNPDENFSDTFMAQIGALHDKVFADIDDPAAANPQQAQPDPLLDGSDTEGYDSSGSSFVSAVSSPSRISFTDSSSQSPNLKYRTLRTLLPLLKFELNLTFPRGATDLGQIVAVEYRYRGRDPSPADSNTNTNQPPRRPTAAAAAANQKMECGTVICVRTFFVEPDTLDAYLAETMRWWRGEREPRGVAPEEAFKCRSCEFAEDCEWRTGLDREALRKARAKLKVRERVAEDSGGEGGSGSTSGGGSRRGRRKRVAGEAATAQI